MEKIDLSKLSEIELITLKIQIESELANYKNRPKTKVFTIYVKNEDTYYFLKKENAINYFEKYINISDCFNSSELKFSTSFLDNSQLDWCEDYSKINLT